MTRSIYRIPVVITICLAFATTAFAAKGLKSRRNPTPRREAAAGGQQVTLEIAGATDAQAAATLRQAFAASGLQGNLRENKKGGKPLKVVAAIDKTTDLSPWAKAVNSSTPNKSGQVSPALELVVYAPLKKENATQTLAQLEKVKGVDAKHSTIDVKKGAARVRISGTDRVTAEDIAKAIEAAGLSPQLARPAKTKKT